MSCAACGDVSATNLSGGLFFIEIINCISVIEVHAVAGPFHITCINRKLVISHPKPVLSHELYAADVAEPSVAVKVDVEMGVFL